MATWAFALRMKKITPSKPEACILRVLYHRAGRNETTELINLPDITGIDVELDGVNFTLPVRGHS
jgi:hypothetical protein